MKSERHAHPSAALRILRYDSATMGRMLPRHAWPSRSDD
jgi:hypothetical protein